MDPLQEHDPQPPRPGRGSALAVWLAVLAVFVAFAAQPTPAENEAHYLAKARHFWQPDWARGDLFLESLDAHWVFHATVGSLTRWFSLSVAAWLGRGLAWGCLAWAFSRLARAVGVDVALIAPAAAVFALLTHVTQWSGEWLLGGVEAKGFAWALVLLAIEQVVRRRPGNAAALLGGATAFHPLVGGWSLVAAIVPWWSLRTELIRSRLIFVMLLFVALGVAPVWLADSTAEASTHARAAWQVYVFQRLPHHLLPNHFPLVHWLGFGAGLAVWCGLGRATRNDAALRVVRTFGAATLGIAAVGGLFFAATFCSPAMCAAVMRFYWFRNLDVLLPLGTALMLARCVQGRVAWLSESRWRHVVLWVASLVVVLLLRPYGFRMPEAERGTTPAQLAAWVEACQWIDQHTPAEACFVTPRLRQTFKWHAQRAEVANWKDVPQDAEHLWAWWTRMLELHTVEVDDEHGPRRRQWIKSLTQQPVERLQSLGARYGAGYLVCGAEPRLALPRLYHNNFYAVYRLDADEVAPP